MGVRFAGAIRSYRRPYYQTSLHKTPKATLLPTAETFIQIARMEKANILSRFRGAAFAEESLRPKRSDDRPRLSPGQAGCSRPPCAPASARTPQARAQEHRRERSRSGQIVLPLDQERPPSVLGGGHLRMNSSAVRQANDNQPRVDS